MIPVLRIVTGTFLYLPGVLILVGGFPAVEAARLVEVGALDRDYLLVHVSDGEVLHHEGAGGEEVIRYAPELDSQATGQVGNWLVRSGEDDNYGAAGRTPVACYRKTKLNGHAQLGWSGGDFLYESTYEHWLCLRLPSTLGQGVAYTLEIGSATNIDALTVPFTFDIYSSRSEAIHVNLVGYTPEAAHKGADLYHWMGSGGARDYSAFEGKRVFAYNVDTGVSEPVGQVAFARSAGSDVGWYNLTRSNVWSVDPSVLSTPGTYRLAVEDVGCSQDFSIGGATYREPFRVSLLGYFYMRIGESNPSGITPPPRTPLYLPRVSPADTRVYRTTMHPFHPEWESFAPGDKWDKPDNWAGYVQVDATDNPDAWGGHSDAADWDRHLAHVVNIYDLLLPYLLTDGRVDDDDVGITESGNGIPDILDEARSEVDFWLRLRDGEGYSHGLTNPTSSNILYQAGATALAAWANAANAAMLAEAFRLAGLPMLMEEYRDAAISAYSYADQLAEPMLDEGISLDDGFLRGRDLKMMAAAFLYNITGERGFEDVVNRESVCAAGAAVLQDASRNQLYGTAAYLTTGQPVHYPALQDAMRNQIVAEARTSEADLMNIRPSRRATDQRPSYWRTAHFMNRTIIAHAVISEPEERAYLQKAMHLEAGWGLGRNPLNMIEMTTATTALAEKRSVPEAYTSGRDDGVAGVHPGHTPYMNLDDWAPGMVMGRPSALYGGSYPTEPRSTWPVGEAYYPSRWVWAHSEFTPRQTMRGKMVLYTYLHGLAAATVPGDADGNGRLELRDSIVVLRLLTGTGDGGRKAADVSGDSRIGLAEAVYVLNQLAGLND